MLADESLAENFAIILRESEEALPLLVLGAANRKMLFVLSSGIANLPFLSALYQTLHEWKTEYIKVKKKPRSLSLHRLTFCSPTMSART
jgi:hypothetical protein